MDATIIMVQRINLERRRALRALRQSGKSADLQNAHSESM
jgi:hypothetical protein